MLDKRRVILNAAVALFQMLVSAGFGDLFAPIQAGAAIAATYVPNIKGPNGDSIEPVADSRFGWVIDLGKSGPGAAQLARPLRKEQGTISFWVRPDWEPQSSESHALLTAEWNDSKHGYLAISDGWWEPTGSRRLYFIVSSEDLAHCSSDIRLPSRVWSLLTAVWSGGEGGYCRLFVDDELRAQTKQRLPPGRSADTVYLGVDSAASNRKGRLGKAAVYGLAILDRPATHKEVIQRYEAEETPESLYEKKWAWLESGVARKSANGQVARQNQDGAKRAIFDEDFGWSVSQAAIDQRLARIKKTGFNIYVPCVWHGQGTLYPTAAAWPDKRLAQRFAAGWDPLAYLLQQAHTLGIAVYPWITVARREDQSHPEWASAGTPDGAYDVHSAEFRKFAVDLMLDLVKRYDVDGINLDYIRAMGICISQSCQRDYESSSGFDLLRDHAILNEDAAARRRIQAWQDAAVADIVSRVSAGAKAIKPALAISVDGHAVSSEADRPLEGRDEIDWQTKIG